MYNDVAVERSVLSKTGETLLLEPPLLDGALGALSNNVQTANHFRLVIWIRKYYSTDLSQVTPKPRDTPDFILLIDSSHTNYSALARCSDLSTALGL